MDEELLRRLLGPLEDLAERHGLTREAQSELVQLVVAASRDGERTWMEASGGEEDLGQAWALALNDALQGGEGPALRGVAPERYADLGLIGQGGMGEVRRARDRELNREIAVKALRRDVLEQGAVRRRFLDEAQVTAQLQHPGVVPVHELGLLEDGRPYFTMPVVQGRTLGQVLREVHGSGGHGQTRRSGWTLRRLVDAFQKVCAAVAYAHSRGVVHRDLKPDNVMLGSFGEVFVMDWGLAKVLDRPEEPLTGGMLLRPSITLSEAMGPETEFGAVVGTPSYMALEQAQGWLDQIGPATDVYALGALLHHVLAGRPPVEGVGRKAVMAIRQGPPVLDLDRPGVPEPLAAICRKALARRAQDRYAHAGELADAVLAWLDSAHQRDQALALVQRAEALGPQIAALHERAQEHAARAHTLHAALPGWASIEDKRPMWAEEDQAHRLEQEGEFVALERLHLLRAALNFVPDLPEANALLAEHYRAQHALAEGRRDHAAARQWELLLRSHHQGRMQAYLQGDGRLTLHTDPPGAEAALFRFELRDRQLQPVLVRALGNTPLVDVSLPMGSYVLRLRAPGYAETLYPVALRREERWDAQPPDTDAPWALRLPEEHVLEAGARLVPGGWTRVGEDPDAPASLPDQRVWVDSFVMCRERVSNAEWLDYLNTLLDEGGEADALAAVPREPGATGVMVYGRDAQGRFVLVPDKDGDLWALDWPVLLVSWEQAMSYAAWRAAREGLPWRLPTELEWEKAGRGADARFFPWGDHFDPGFCHADGSQPGRPVPAPAAAFPTDCSVYGVLGLAGGARELCLDLEEPTGAPVHPRVERGRAVVPPPWTGSVDGLYCVTRGGSWMSTAANTRLANRARVRATARSEAIGLRLVRSWTGG